MKKQDRLTVVDKILDEQAAKTPVGMAFWAGTGPKGKTCRECRFYTFNGYKSARGNKGGQLKNSPCQKFIALTNGVDTNRIPYDTSSCKYFDQNPAPPTITDQGK